MTQQQPLSPGDLKQVLASAHKRSGKPAPNPTPHTKAQNPHPRQAQIQEAIVYNGKTYVINAHMQITISANAIATSGSSLIDRGANAGMAGADVRLLETTGVKVDVSGIDNHTLPGLDLATVAGVVQTQRGPICLIMNQYAYLGKGKTIHSCSQIEHFGSDVNDKSLKITGGKQRIVTLDGYVIPLQIRGGLAYLDMHPPSDHELETLPHSILTSDSDWDPSCLDNEIDPSDWADTFEDPPLQDYGSTHFDLVGNYRGQVHSTTLYYFDTIQPPDNAYDLESTTDRLNHAHMAHPHVTT